MATRRPLTYVKIHTTAATADGRTVVDVTARVRWSADNRRQCAILNRANDRAIDRAARRGFTAHTAETNVLGPCTSTLLD